MKLITAVKQILILAVFVFQTETYANLRCEHLFQSALPQIKSGSEILHEKDSKLHMSQLVQKAISKHKQSTGVQLTKPNEKLNLWLSHLEKLSKKADSSPRTLDQIKTILNIEHVIKPSDVPENYYALQVKLARERGHGEISLNDQQRKQLADTVINDQKKSLEVWTEYLVSKDSDMYPMWMKYWMFTGMTKLSKYNQATGQFGNRDKSTVTPFAELNREAIGIVVDHVLKHIQKKSLEDINDPELIQLLPGLNFGKLYGHVLLKMGFGKDGAFKTNQGQWKIYPQGSDHMPLVKSLEGRNTGWCTAGESTAQSQLKNGDFHVYYSFDQNGQPTIPRVAIRMEGGEIAEVRGVAEQQNLDSQINQSTVVTSKMKEFGPKATKFEKKDSDMKKLTAIESKHESKIELSKEEIFFLYELKESIAGFGYGSDPRIYKIKSERDFKSDIMFVFDNKYTRDEITTTEDEVLRGRSKLHIGDLNLKTITSAKGLNLPDVVYGNLYFRKLTSAEGLKLPSRLNGNLDLNALTSADGLRLPEILNGGIDLGRITSAKGLELPETLNGDLDLGALGSAAGLKLPETINGRLLLGGLSSAAGLKLPETVYGGTYLTSLTSARGLKLPKSMVGSLGLNGLKSAQELKLPETMYGNLDLSRLTSTKGLKLPETLNGFLDLRNLTSAEGLILPNTLTGGLDLRTLTSFKGLKLPDTLDGDLKISGLTSARGLKLPDTLNGNLSLSGLTSATGLKLPRAVNGNLYLGGLISAMGLKLPDTINGDLSLSGLTSAAGLKLPDTINGDLYLRSLKSAQQLKLPKGVTDYEGPPDIQR